MKARLRRYRHPRQQDFHRWRKGAIIGAGALGLTALVPSCDSGANGIPRIDHADPNGCTG